MTPAQIRAEIDRCRAMAASCLRQADVLEMLLAELETGESLTSGQQAVNTGDVTSEHRASLSRSAPKGKHPVYTHIGKRDGAYPSLRALAQAADVDVGFLSRIFNGKAAMPDAVAARLETLIPGYTKPKRK